MNSQSEQRATFILSLDCEGRWGAADRDVGPRDARITDESLAWVYRTLFEILDRHEIPATFAVVGLFALGKDRGRAVQERLRESPAHRRWLEAAARRMEAWGSTGWYLPDLPDRVLSSGVHELASHSACHLPLGGPDVDAASVAADLEAMRMAGELLGHQPRTLVFPRNQVEGVETLESAGYLGYRAADRADASLKTRLRRFSSELDLRARSQAHTEPSPGVTAVPRGEVLNWRAGARRAIPRGVTVRRWRNIVRDATATGGVAHLWLHPHNLATGDRMMTLLDDALATVAGAVRAGDMEVRTQAEYSREHIC